MMPLSPMERAAVALLLRGMADKEIARELGVATSTVKQHMQSARIKAGVSTRLQLALAAERGEIDVRPATLRRVA